ncbi:hypothetical protein ACMD2_27029 [Ananas comosus]|uniref:Uncharacterized protein n=1 Tax=Ananas comosus TaxID=4615 RepID=A0A199UYN0_ANACO|nr:hypothetical protein ACMD2_27029 [Ananas comosus]
MTQEVTGENSNGENDLGVVKGELTYTIMDDLYIRPMSTISSITLLNTLTPVFRRGHGVELASGASKHLGSLPWAEIHPPAPSPAVPTAGAHRRRRPSKPRPARVSLGRANSSLGPARWNRPSLVALTSSGLRRHPARRCPPPRRPGAPTEPPELPAATLGQPRLSTGGLEARTPPALHPAAPSSLNPRRPSAAVAAVPARRRPPPDLSAAIWSACGPSLDPHCLRAPPPP